MDELISKLSINDNQKKGLKRNTIDKYYTKDAIVNLCINYIKQNIEINLTDDLVIESSAGDGAFINEIKKLSNNVKFYDIEPEHNEIIKQDYLLLDYEDLVKKYNKIHIISNPPFGRQSSLVIKFIKKSCNFADTISFILPKSFKKDSLKKKFPLNFHLIFEIDLPDKSFLVNNIEYDVPCIFQIWIKKSINRIVKQDLEPKNFIFVKNKSEADISFVRVGVKAGSLYKEVIEKNINSHYFIKFTNEKSIDENINTLSNITYDFNNTVGPKSISKQELIFKFNSLL